MKATELTFLIFFAPVKEESFVFFYSRFLLEAQAQLKKNHSATAANLP